MEIEYRELKYEELKDLRKIDRRQTISRVYSFEAGSLREEEFKLELEKWDEDELRAYIKSLEEIYSRAYILGAFSGEELVGLMALDKKYLDEKKEYICLDKLYVSHDYRNLSIGKKLVAYGLREARKTSAKYLYISSSNFLETVEFYKGLGAELTRPIESMYEKEPEDIHMRIEL